MTKRDNLTKITALTRDFIERKQDSVAVYTDGSRNSEKQVGIGLHIPSLNISKSYRLTDGTQVYTAELCAIEQALKYLVENKSTPEIR